MPATKGFACRWRLPADGNLASRADALPPSATAPRRPPLLDRLLRARGIIGADAVEQFCSPRLTDLHDPALLPGIDRAVDRIIHAVRTRQRIVIYGDYDVDGITATAILYRIIKVADPDAHVVSYIPHRLDEGYGLNAAAIEQIARDGADVIITVDCGVTATEPAAAARRLGVDLIITDHHNLPADGDPLPDAFTIVHPRLSADGAPQGPGAYPFGDLCGAGVAFKIAWRFATAWCGSERVADVFQRTLLDMLPLAALGTIADVAPMVGENRVITSFGLRAIRQTTNIGLRALIEASNLMRDEVDCHKVGFVLAPRLNACGRLGHAADAMRLMITHDPAEARALAVALTSVNEQRQKTERAIVDHAAGLAEDRGMTGSDCRAIVLAHASWHAGVVGIVCSRLVERYCRPTILMQVQGGVCKGSGRSIDGYSIHAGLAAAADHLLTWGGHDMAAGLSLDAARLEAFADAFTTHANSHIGDDDLTPAIRIDCDAVLYELDPTTVEAIGTLAPFGRGNPRPAVRLRRVILDTAPMQMGGQGRHLDLRVRTDAHTSDGVTRTRRQLLRCVWWNGGRFAGDLAAGMPLDIVIQPRLNTWKGVTRVEGEVRDVRLVAVNEPASC